MTKPEEEIKIKEYNEIFERIWKNSSGFNQLEIKDLNNKVVELLSYAEKREEELIKKVKEVIKKYIDNLEYDMDASMCEETLLGLLKELEKIK